jgi:hypothetical protein
LGFKQPVAISQWFDIFNACGDNRQQMSLLCSPLLQIAIKLIHKFARSLYLLTIERKRIKGLQTETETKLVILMFVVTPPGGIAPS